MNAPRTPAPALLSSTLILLRDGVAGLEVLLMTRHAASGFAGGAMVFPGGKIAEEDKTLCGADADALAPFRIAAIREAYEECGILLARKASAPTPLLRAALAELKEKSASDIAFHALLTAGGLQPCTEDLVHYAHWITPATSPRRFDTHFFAARAPEDQVAAHDGREATGAVWITPVAALAEADAGRAKLVFVTRMNLRRLARSRTVDEALDAARRSTVVTVMPHVTETPAGAIFRIPAEAGYEVTEMLVGRDQRP